MIASRQSGFTLLEVVVAISVSAVLVALVYGALSIGYRSWEAGHERIDAIDAERIGWQFLHNALNGARLVDDPLSAEHRPLFNGAGNGVRFVADMPAWLGLGGMYVVELDVVDNGDRRSLRLRRTLLAEYRQPNTENHVHAAILVDDLDSLSIRYFGTPDPESDPAWRNAWSAAGTLPLLIELQVQPRAAGAWPVLIARPQFGSDRVIAADVLETAR